MGGGTAVRAPLAGIFFDPFVMKKNSWFRPQVLLLLLSLLVSAPALWSCNTETAAQKVVREHEEQLKIIDDDTIRHYIQRNGLQATKTSSGLYVVNVVNGTGPPVTTGKQVRVKYLGKFLSNGAHPPSTGYPLSYGNSDFRVGSIFDNSSENHTLCGCAVFTAGSGVVAGFSEGLLLMREGDRKLLLLPSRLAYGPAGQVNSANQYVIPTDAAVLFDVEVLEVF